MKESKDKSEDAVRRYHLIREALKSTVSGDTDLESTLADLVAMPTENNGSGPSNMRAGDTDLNDNCLGAVADMFADELNSIRGDEHFKGTPRDLAVMADIMRCISDGMGETEKKILLGMGQNTSGQGPKGPDVSRSTG
ncbi:unnamed protein product [Discosporangium mesarthrocarpum]